MARISIPNWRYLRCGVIRHLGRREVSAALLVSGIMGTYFSDSYIGATAPGRAVLDVRCLVSTVAAPNRIRKLARSDRWPVAPHRNRRLRRSDCSRP